jgi:hypothetical protein
MQRPPNDDEMSSPEPDQLLKTAEDLKRGGWIVGVLGAAGALCRLLVTDEELAWVMWIRRIIAGAIVGVLSYFVVHGRADPLYEAIIYAVCGTAAPELIEMARRRIIKHVETETSPKKRNR